MYWALVILALGFLIFVHELGHYLVARWCGMKVDKFSIGFGPAILKWKDKNGAQFQLSPILFGGYVAIAGMNIGEDVDPTDKTAYPNKPTWQRIAAIFAGPAFNYMGAMVLAFILFVSIGQPTGRVMVGATDVGFDAHGKLLPGDTLVAVNGEPSKGASKFIESIQRSKGEPVMVSVLRDGAPVDLKIQPSYAWWRHLGQLARSARIAAYGPAPANENEAPPTYRIGIHLKAEREARPVGSLFVAAFKEPYEIAKLQLTGLARLVRGIDKPDVRGPVGIVSMMKEEAEAGWIYLLGLMMTLNVYLAIFNLLPLPALDGGRLAFLGYELITRRRANQKIEALVHMVGIMFFFVLFIIVTYNDCARLVGR